MRGMRHFLAALLTAALLLSLAACGSTNSAGQLRLYYPAELSTKRRSTGGGDAIASVQVDWQQSGGDLLGRQQQALLVRFRVPLFLAMLIPWAWCCQQGIYIALASRTYSNYILCASISVCGIWLFCNL